MDNSISFLAFCITVIALTAIVFGQNEIATKALTALLETTKGMFALLSRAIKPQATTDSDEKSVEN